MLFWYFFDVILHDIFKSIEEDLYFKVITALLMVQKSNVNNRSWGQKLSWQQYWQEGS